MAAPTRSLAAPVGPISNSKTRSREKVRGGLEGCLHLAHALAYRYYRRQLVCPDDRKQAAALAAVEAFAKYPADRELTLQEVTKAIRAVLYQQAKAYGFKIINSRRPDGSRTAGWTSQEILFSELPAFSWGEPCLPQRSLMPEIGEY